MEIGKKIKQLRYRAGWTQEQLAEKLSLSAQAISKWENSVSMPDISLLPLLAEAFGVSIDELFDLTAEQKLNRIESRLEIEEELPADVFSEYQEFLSQQLNTSADRQRNLSLLAKLYHLRMEVDAGKVSRYAREAIRLKPGQKDCQWLLELSENAAGWDWNVENHAKTIEFYKEVILSDPSLPRSPLPYYFLIDQLIADHRADEAEEALKEYTSLPGHKPFMAEVYKAHIALARYDKFKADSIMAHAKTIYGSDGGFLFELAQYHARNCEYSAAIENYEASYAAEEKSKPRFYDALQGIAIIHEIQGEYRFAAAAYDRILENLHSEWGFTEEACVSEIEREKIRVLQRCL